MIAVENLTVRAGSFALEGVSFALDSGQYGVLMGGTLLAVLPVLVLFFVLQKDFIAGLTSGAVKG